MKHNSYASGFSWFFTLTLRMGVVVAHLIFAALAAASNAPLPTIFGRRLVAADGQSFQIRAVDYSPTPIGLARPANNAQVYTVPIMQRDGPLLAELGANTLRIYDALRCDTSGNAVTYLTPAFVAEAANQGMWLVAGSYIDPATDFSNATIRSKIVAAHVAFVHQFKTEPAILMWAPGNEVNFFAPASQLANWNSLLDTISVAIKTEQGGGSGPGFGAYVCSITNFANHDGSIGVAPQSSVPNVDIFACNIFNGPTYGALFVEVEARSTKPFWVAECGIDSYDNTHAVEDETMQGLFVRSLWREIETRSDIACGAAIGFWVDEWWKAGSPTLHDSGGTAFGHGPDNFINEEYLGLLRPSVNPGGGPDLLQKKAAWYAVQDVWSEGGTAGFSGGAPFQALFDAFTELGYTYNNYGGFHFGIYGTEAGAQDFRVTVGVVPNGGAGGQAGDSAFHATGSLPKGASFTYFSVIFTLFPNGHPAGHDFTSFDTIRFDVRTGATDAYARFNLRLEDSEGSTDFNNKEIPLPVLTTSFQRVEIPLSSFITGSGQLVNLSKLAQIVVNARTDLPPAGNYKLDLIIDNLEIVKTSPDTTAFVTNIVPGTLRNDYSGWVGMQIAVGPSPLSVSQLGRMVIAGNAGTHAVKLVKADGFDVAGGAAMVVTSGATAGQFQYGNLSSPVTLSANTTYWVLSQETAGGDRWYEWNTTLTTTGVAAAFGLAWGQGPGSWATYSVANQSFVPVNFKYTVVTTATPYITGTVPGTLRNDYSGWVGMRVTVGPSPLSVSQLGRYVVTGNSGTHAVKLVQADGFDVTGGAVTVATSGATAGQFKYSNLSNPVTLAAVTTYWVLSQEAGGGDRWYEWNTTLTTTGAAAAIGLVWGQGPGTWATYSVANQSWVPVNFKYTAVTTATPYVTGTGLGTLRNDYSGWVGMQVTVGPSPLTVSQLGRMVVTGNSGAHAVKLVKADGSDVTGGAATVVTSGATAGQFSYGILTSPVTLSAATTYWVLSQETAGGDKWYEWNTTLTTTGVAAAVGLAWGTGPGAWATYPVANQSFGPVNFRY